MTTESRETSIHSQQKSKTTKITLQSVDSRTISEQHYSSDYGIIFYKLTIVKNSE